MTPDEVLQGYRIDGYKRAFLLAVKASRVSFAAQQMRAFNLVWALSETQPVADKSVAVIGAGLAGLTAAVALRLLGAKVTLFEKANTEMHLQRGNSTRHIHPNIIDWPSDESERNLTSFPFLNWHAGMCNEVSAWIMEQWQELHDSISLRFQTVATIGGEDDTNVSVLVENKSEPFTFVIACVGFGLEQTLSGLPFLSYWDNDNLARADLQSQKRRRFLVCGAGDGALIDIARILVADFDHAKITEFVFDQNNERIRADFARIEDHLIAKIARGEFGSRKQSAANAGNWLGDQYDRLEFESDRIGKEVRLREDVSVTFCAPSGCEYSIKASAVHRFLLWILRNLDRDNADDPRLKFVPGAAIIEKDWNYWLYFVQTWTQKILFPAATAPSLKPPYKVRIGDHITETFDDVIVRTGPIGNRIVQSAPAKPAELASLDKPVRYYPIPYFSKNVVHFHNGRLEELMEDNVFRHGCTLLPELHRALRTNRAIISLGYMARHAQFQAVVNWRQLVNDLPDRFRSVSITKLIVPRRRGEIVHDDFRPVGVNTLFCGIPIEFGSEDHAALAISSKIAFYVSVNGSVRCVLPYVTDVPVGTKVFRQEMLSEAGFIGTVTEVHPPSGRAAGGIGCLLAELKGNYRISNTFGRQYSLAVDVRQRPLDGLRVCSHLSPQARGKVTRIDFQATIHTYGRIVPVAHCFGIIPLMELPFAKADDLLSLVITEQAEIVGVVVGVTLGQAAALPIDTFLHSLDAALLTGRYENPNFREGIHFFGD